MNKIELKAAMEEFLNNFKDSFPTPFSGKRYWSTKIPGNKNLLINADKEVKKICISGMLSAYLELNKNIPKNYKFVKIAILINITHLFYSDIIVFFSETEYEKFFSNRTHIRQWKRIPYKTSLLSELGIQINMPGVKFLEKIRDVDYKRDSEILLYGDIPKKLVKFCIAE